MQWVFRKDSKFIRTICESLYLCLLGLVNIFAFYGFDCFVAFNIKIFCLEDGQLRALVISKWEIKIERCSATMFMFFSVSKKSFKNAMVENFSEIHCSIFLNEKFTIHNLSIIKS